MGRTADALFEAVCLDQMPGMGALVDFGINSPEDFGAYQFVLKRGLVTPDELHASAGKGEELTELIRRGKGQCLYCDRTITTTWDDMEEDLDEELDDAPAY